MCGRWSGIFFAVIFSASSVFAESTDPELAIWAAQTKDDEARCMKAIERSRATADFPWGEDQLHPGLGQVTTDPTTGAGSFEFSLANWTPKPIAVKVSAELFSYWGSRLDSFGQTATIEPNHSLTHSFTVPNVDAHRYHLVVTATDVATGRSRISHLYPLFDDFKNIRRQLSLNGQWLSTNSDSPTCPGKECSTWKPMTIPASMGSGSPGDRKYFWIKREFTLPNAMIGECVVVQFDAVGHNAEVFVNGRGVGTHADAYTPFEADITSAVNRSGANEIAVRVSKADRVKEDGKDRSLQPLGAGDGLGCYDVSIVSRSALHVADQCVRTSTRKGELTTLTTLINDSKKTANVVLVTSVIDAAGKVVRTARSESLTLAPGQSHEISHTDSWADARVWWPHDPYMYRLRSEIVADGQTVDAADLRFGFREVWCDGQKIKLNGKDAWLRRTSIILRWSGGIVPEVDARQFQRLQQQGHNFSRFHMEPPPSYCVDIADEMGMLTSIEAALWTSAGEYAMLNENFWKNVSAHLAGIAKKYRNHPSLIMYSPENEWMYVNISGIYPRVVPQHWPMMSAAIRAVDPTRPLSYDADGDAGGNAETRNLHYPQDWDARWPLPNHAFIDLGPKPVIFGEFMMGEVQVANQSLQIFGDRGLMPPVARSYRAYNSGPYTHNPYNLKTVALFCDAYRLHGMAGMNPWFFESELDGFFSHVLVTAKNMPHGFVSGTTQNIALDVLYDVFNDQTITIRSTLDACVASSADRSKLTTAEQSLSLIGGSRPRISLAMPVPAVDVVTPTIWQIDVIGADGQTLFTRKYDVTVFPNRPLSATVPVVLYDPQQRLSELASAAHVAASASWPTITDVTKMIVVACSEKSPLSKAQCQQLEQFVDRGGKVVMIEQSGASTFLPVGIAIDGAYDHTYAFVRAPNHPLMKHLRDIDVQQWGPENWVTRAAFLKPDVGNTITLVESGTTGGLNNAPMIELRRGRGSYIFCQMTILENTSLPAVRQMLQNILDYAAAELPTRTPLAVVDAKGNVASVMAGLGVPLQSFGADGDKAQPKAKTAIVDAQTAMASTATIAALRSFAESGGTVWLHRLTPQTLASFEPLVGAITLTKIPDSGTDVGFATVPANQLIRAGTPTLLDGIGQAELTGFAVADYAVGNLPMNATKLTVPVALATIPVGRGRILIDQIAWDNLTTPASYRRILCPLLTHLNVAAEARRPTSLTMLYRPLELPTHAAEQDAAKASSAWPKMYEKRDNVDLTDPVMSRKEFHGVPFCLPKSDDAPTIVTSAKAMRVDLGRTRTSSIVMLGAAMKEVSSGQTIGRLDVEYADKTRVSTPILMNDQLAAFHGSEKPSLKSGELAWRSSDASQSCLYQWRWSNPHPEKMVTTVSIAATDAHEIMVAAVTLASETIRCEISAASATVYRGDRREEGQAGITFHQKDRVVWTLDNIESASYWITLGVRTGGGISTAMVPAYHLKLNGREIPLGDAMLPCSLGATASDGSWKVWGGCIRVRVPLTLKAGDELVLTTTTDWVSVDRLQLDTQRRVRLAETFNRDNAYADGSVYIHGMTLDREIGQ